MNISELEKVHNSENRVWRNKLTWRNTGKGMNQNVIGTYAPYNSKEEIVKYMRANLTPYTDGRKYLDRKSKYADYFRDVVNECMGYIMCKERGYVFTESQLREVMMMLPDVRVKYSDNEGCYWCWK